MIALRSDILAQHVRSHVALVAACTTPSDAPACDEIHTTGATVL